MRRWLTRILICLILGAVMTIGVAWGIASARPQLDLVEPEGEGYPIFILFHDNDEAWSFVVVRRGFGTECFDAGGKSPIDELHEPKEVAAWIDDYRRMQPQVYKLSAAYGEWLADIGPQGSWISDRVHGWPIHAVRCEALIDELNGKLVLRETRFALNTGRSEIAIPAFSGVFPIVDERTRFRLLPLRPIFPGFLIDTLFYSAIWFGLFFGFGAARRGLRKKRGRCPICAYDLRGGAMSPAGSRASPSTCAGSRASPRGCPECGWNRIDAQPPGEAGG